MKLTELLPLLGVATGWMLKELSDHVRHRFAARGQLGIALTGLLKIDNELHRLNVMLSAQKGRPISWDQYEIVRRETAKRYLARSNPRELIKVAVDELARYDPVWAAALHDIAETLMLAYHATLPSAESDEAAYIKALSVMEVAAGLSEKLLKRLILKLARLHGPVTWIRIRWDWRRRAARGENRAFVKAQIRDLYNEAPGNTDANVASGKRNDPSQ